MTTENKSVVVNGVKVKHLVVSYMLNVPTKTVIARSPNGPTSGTVVSQGSSNCEKGYYCDEWTWKHWPARWEDVTAEWRAKEKHAYTQKPEPKTPIQESEPTLSVLDEVALKLLPMVYQIADGDGSMYRHENCPVGLAQEAYRLAEAFMKEKLARDNKPVDTE